MNPAFAMRVAKRVGSLLRLRRRISTAAAEGKTSRRDRRFMVRARASERTHDDEYCVEAQVFVA
jgi:hypothetical protein